MANTQDTHQSSGCCVFNTCSRLEFLVDSLCSGTAAEQNFVIHDDRSSCCRLLITNVPEPFVTTLQNRLKQLDSFRLIQQEETVTVVITRDGKLFQVVDGYDFETLLESIKSVESEHSDVEKKYHFDVREHIPWRLLKFADKVSGQIKLSCSIIYHIRKYVCKRQDTTSDRGRSRFLKPRSFSKESHSVISIESKRQIGNNNAKSKRNSRKVGGNQLSDKRGYIVVGDKLEENRSLLARKCPHLLCDLPVKENLSKRQKRSICSRLNRKENSLPARKQNDDFYTYEGEVVSLHPSKSVGKKRLFAEMFREVRDITNFPERIVGLRDQGLIVYPGRSSRHNTKQPASNRRSGDRERSPSSTRAPVQVSEDTSSSETSRPVTNIATGPPTLTRGNMPLPTTNSMSFEQQQALLMRRQGQLNNQRQTQLSSSVPPAPPRHPQYEGITAREESFVNWPESTGQDPQTLVTYGMFHTGRFDLVRCYHCGIGLKDWSAEDQPLLEHIRNAPDCPFLLQLLGREVLTDYRLNLIGDVDPANAPSQGVSGGPAQRLLGGAETHTPASGPGRPGITPEEGASDPTFLRNLGRLRSPRYQKVPDRIRSFDKWPAHIIQTPRQLALAGFYYTGFGDVCRCFCCDGGLQRWDPQDDPFVEHARWFPQCRYIRGIKGDDFVELVQQAARSIDDEDDDPAVIYPPPGQGDLNRAMGNLAVQDPMESPAAQSALSIGYSKSAVNLAIHELNAKGKTGYTASDIVEILIDKQDRGEALPSDSGLDEGAIGGAASDDPEVMAKENQRLLGILKCINCEERNTNILFLPCTHHRLCEECAKDAKICPLCGKEVEKKIKTYLA